MQEKCEKARGVLSLARELSCGLLCSPEAQSLLAGYPPETNEKKKKIWQKLTVLGYKCPSFSFPVEIAPCCYTLDIGNKRDHLNVHVSVTKYIKKHVIKINGEIKHKKSQILRYFSHFPSTSKKLGCHGYAKIYPLLSVFGIPHHTALPPPPPPLLPGF